MGHCLSGIEAEIMKLQLKNMQGQKQLKDAQEGITRDLVYSPNPQQYPLYIEALSKISAY